MTSQSLCRPSHQDGATNLPSPLIRLTTCREPRSRSMCAAVGAIEARLSHADRAGAFGTDTASMGRRPTQGKETGQSIRTGPSHPDTHRLSAAHPVVQRGLPSFRPTLKHFLRRCWPAGVSRSRPDRSAPRAPSLSTARASSCHVLLPSRVLPSGRSSFGYLLNSAACMVGLAGLTFGYASSAASAPTHFADRSSPPGCR
jgi:hypothetical protein